jgi:RNA polymerase sigma-70 factor, ECF subfamily
LELILPLYQFCLKKLSYSYHRESVVSTLDGRNAIGGSCSATHNRQTGEEAVEPEETHAVKAKPSTILAEGKRSPDVQEFQRVYQENLDLIYHYVFRQVGNREEAEDLTSHIFLKAVRGIDTERTPQSMQKWLFQVARTTIADYWRVHYRASAQSLDALVEAGWEGPAENAIAIVSHELEDRVQCLLQDLPEHYRDVLTYRFLLNLSVKDTALRMGVTEANVKVLQFRALKRAAELENNVARSEVIS